MIFCFSFDCLTFSLILLWRCLFFLSSCLSLSIIQRPYLSVDCCGFFFGIYILFKSKKIRKVSNCIEYGHSIIVYYCANKTIFFCEKKIAVGKLMYISYYTVFSILAMLCLGGFFDRSGKTQGDKPDTVAFVKFLLKFDPMQP